MKYLCVHTPYLLFHLSFTRHIFHFFECLFTLIFNFPSTKLRHVTQQSTQQVFKHESLLKQKNNIVHLKTDFDFIADFIGFLRWPGMPVELK